MHCNQNKKTARDILVPQATYEIRGHHNMLDQNKPRYSIHLIAGFSLIALFISGLLILLYLGKIEIDFWNGIIKIFSKS
jgi:hypothetical protein